MHSVCFVLTSIYRVMVSSKEEHNKPRPMSAASNDTDTPPDAAIETAESRLVEALKRILPTFRRFGGSLRL